MKKIITNENSDNKIKQPPVSEWIISPLRIVNLILALFFLATALPLFSYHSITGFGRVVYLGLFIWLVCAFLLFFRNRIAWFCSLLGLGLMIYNSALLSIFSLVGSFTDHDLKTMATCIFTIFPILWLTVLVGLLKRRRKSTHDIMNKTPDNKPKQSSESKWIPYPVYFVNLILALFFLLVLIPLPQYHVRAGILDYVLFTMIHIWVVCAIFSFFWSRLVWFGCLPVGIMIWKFNPSASTIFVILLILCLTVFVGLLKYRKALWK